MIGCCNKERLCLQINLYISLKVLTWNHQKLNYHKSECISKMLSAQVIRPPVRKSHIDPLHLQSHRVEQKSSGKFLENMNVIWTTVWKLKHWIQRWNICDLFMDGSEWQSPTATPRNTVWRTKRGELKHYAVVTDMHFAFHILFMHYARWLHQTPFISSRESTSIVLLDGEAFKHSVITAMSRYK